MARIRSLALFTFLLGMVAQPPAGRALPALRLQVDQRGDFVLFGNTLAAECANGVPAPVAGVLGPCGVNLFDTGPDVFWRADAPAAGQAVANTGIAPAEARSTAVLQLPPGATITHARIYWGALLPDGAAAADTTITLERPGVRAENASADASWVVAKPGEPLVRWYQSTADVTALVRALGPGPYRVSGVESVDLRNLDSPDTFAAWAMVVLFEQDGDVPTRNIALFDGLDAVAAGQPARASLSGFVVPNAGFDAKLGVLAYEGDATLVGDSLVFQSVPLSNAQNPSNNFFNSTRSLLGAAVSVAGDLPQLTGAPGSMSGVDIDVVDVTGLLRPGDTSATVEATSDGDTYLLGMFVTSISTLRPDLSSSTKIATDLNGGAVRPGDEIEYTIVASNRGSDASDNTVLRDALPAGVTYVPGSLRVSSGPNVGSKTDRGGDDEGEYDAPARTVIVRLGAGATALRGGRLEPGQSSTVQFRVTLDAGASGRILNQGVISAEGVRGAPAATFPTDGDVATPGAQPTPVAVGGCTNDAECAAPTPFCRRPVSPGVCVECLDNTACSGTRPVCDTASFTCVPCTLDGQCTDPARPVCNRSGVLAGACTECSAASASRCVGSKPECLIDLGICGCSSTDGDAECGATTSGIVCTGAAGICAPGCSVAPGRNGCPATQVCSDLDGGVGSCRAGCQNDAQCRQPPLTHCDGPAGLCVQCLADEHCAPPLVCDTTASKRCLECTPAKLGNCGPERAGAVCLESGTCGCTRDSDCGGPTSGRVCDPALSKCTFGCRGTGGNRCRPPLLCTSATDAIGRCVAVGDGGVVDGGGGGGACGAAGDGTPCGGDGICLRGTCQRLFTGGGCTCSSGGAPLGFLGVALLAWVLAARRRGRHR